MALREFVGDDGQEWQVWDTRPAPTPPNVSLSGPDGFEELPRISKKREGGWLTFTSAAGRWRLSPIPEDWESADETGLKTMLAAADQIGEVD